MTFPDSYLVQHDLPKRESLKFGQIGAGEGFEKMPFSTGSPAQLGQIDYSLIEAMYILTSVKNSVLPALMLGRTTNHGTL